MLDEKCKCKTKIQFSYGSYNKFEKDLDRKN